MNDNIKLYRINKNLSQEYVARKIGCSLRHYQYIEERKSTPTVYLALLIAKTLETPIENIFSIEEYKIKKQKEKGNP